MTRTAIVHTDVPVDPDAPEARRLLEDELSAPVYTSAEPTAFDLAVQALLDGIGSLLTGADADFGPLLLALVVGAVIAVVVITLIVFGLPRRRRRAHEGRALFGHHETRTADELRRSAREAATAKHWSTAIEDRYRAIARELADRTIVTVDPGTTARSFAQRAGSAFPGHDVALSQAAKIFDGVRYLGSAGTEAEYTLIADLDESLATTTPAAWAAPSIGSGVAS